MCKKSSCKLKEIGNLSLDIGIWLVSIIIGLTPAIIMSLFYPNDDISGMAPVDRIFSDIEVVFAFLTSVALLIIEQLQVEDVNVKARNTLTKSKRFFLLIDVIFMILYVSMKPFGFKEIEELLAGNLVTLNKWVIILSLFMSVSLLITHSLQNPDNPNEEVKKDEDNLSIHI